MEILGNIEILEEFEHRGREVGILMADHGAVHCKVQHEYFEIACANCGAPIESEKVLLIHVDDVDLGVYFAHLDLSDAVEFAKQYIDDLDDSDDDDDDGGSPFTSPPKNPGRKRRGKKDPHSALVPPTGGTQGPLTEVIERLKWAGEGLRIIREIGGGTGKKKKK